MKARFFNDVGQESPSGPVRRSPALRDEGGFTLLELMTALAITSMIVVMLFAAFNQASRAWTTAENRVETFTDARAVLDLMARELSQAVATPNITFHGDNQAVYFVAPVNSNPANHADLCEVGYEYRTVTPYEWKIVRHLTEPTTLNIASGGFWDFYNNATWWQTFDPNAEASLATNSILNIQFTYLNANGTPITIPFGGLTANTLPAAIVISLDAIDSRTATRLRLVPAAAWLPITNSTLRSFSITVYMNH